MSQYQTIYVPVSKDTGTIKELTLNRRYAAFRVGFLYGFSITMDESTFMASTFYRANLFREKFNQENDKYFMTFAKPGLDDDPRIWEKSSIIHYYVYEKNTDYYMFRNYEDMAVMLMLL